MKTAAQHANVRNLDTSSWKYETWLDNSGLQVGEFGLEGAYVDQERRVFVINGEEIEGLGILHATKLYYETKLINQGQDETIYACSFCNQGIRYAVIYKDDKGEFHVTGETCGDFVEAGVPNNVFLERRKLQGARKVETKNGPRLTLRIAADERFWKIWKHWKATKTKPSFISVSKYTDQHGNTQWSATIWAEDKDELTENYHVWLEAKGAGSCY